jgi:hypothetical protein
MLKQQRLGEDGSSAAGEQQLGNRRDEMDGENDQVTHPAMLTIRVGAARLGSSRDPCDRFEFATHTLCALDVADRPRCHRYGTGLEHFFHQHSAVGKVSDLR